MHLFLQANPPRWLFSQLAPLPAPLSNISPDFIPSYRAHKSSQCSRKSNVAANCKWVTPISKHLNKTYICHKRVKARKWKIRMWTWFVMIKAQFLLYHMHTWVHGVLHPYEGALGPLLMNCAGQARPWPAPRNGSWKGCFQTSTYFSGDFWTPTLQTFWARPFFVLRDNPYRLLGSTLDPYPPNASSSPELSHPKMSLDFTKWMRRGR